MPLPLLSAAIPLAKYLGAATAVGLGATFTAKSTRNTPHLSSRYSANLPETNLNLRPRRLEVIAPPPRPDGVKSSLLSIGTSADASGQSAHKVTASPTAPTTLGPYEGTPQGATVLSGGLPPARPLTRELPIHEQSNQNMLSGKPQGQWVELNKGLVPASLPQDLNIHLKESDHSEFENAPRKRLDLSTHDADQSLLRDGWGVLGTAHMFTAPITQDLLNQLNDYSRPSSFETRSAYSTPIQIANLGETRHDASAFYLEGDTKDVVQEWAINVFQRLDTLFPNEQLKVGHVSLLRDGQVQSKPGYGAHADSGAYLHALNTLIGPSTWIYPGAKLDRSLPNDGGMYRNSLFEEKLLVTPAKDTLIFGGTPRRQTPPLVHSSPMDQLSAKRLLLMMKIWPK